MAKTLSDTELKHIKTMLNDFEKDNKERASWEPEKDEYTYHKGCIKGIQYAKAILSMHGISFKE